VETLAATAEDDHMSGVIYWALIHSRPVVHQHWINISMFAVAVKCGG
jgi:hypothetical protein